MKIYSLGDANIHAIYIDFVIIILKSYKQENSL